MLTTTDAELVRIHEIARGIAAHLFTNGGGSRADRLVLTVDGPPKRDLGGLGESVVVDVIVEYLKRNRGALR